MNAQPISHKKEAQIIHINALHRILMLSGFAVTGALYFISFLMLLHYTCFPLPFFSAPSLSSSPYKTPTYLKNAFLYAMFFVQHIIMAHIILKRSLSRISSIYPLYQRIIFNLVSSIFYIYTLHLATPVATEEAILFRTP